MATPTPSCSILVVSSDVEESKDLINRIVTSSSSKGVEIQTATETEHIPWIISNKYYTAPVHFSLKEIQEVNSDLVAEVPAFIFVFDPIEDYQDIFTRLLHTVKDSDFEVSLAVSVSKTGNNKPTEEQVETYETYFSSLGFEYIYGHVPDNLPSQEQITENLDGIPGLGRIIDALSTILWPSMVRKTRHTKTRSVIHIPNEEEGLRSLLSADSDMSGLTTRQQEMVMLEKWLEAATFNDDGWQEARNSSNLEENSSSKRPGFDDNFSDFVSASTSSQTKNDDESELPSRREVEETTRRIMESEKHNSHKNDKDDDDEGHFDLTQVLAGLELMKSEIANIQDDNERRRAAAKVALSVAYGFDNSNYDFHE